MTLSNGSKYAVRRILTLFLGFAPLAWPAGAEALPQAAPEHGAGPSANRNFVAEADEVLEQMSEITGLKLQTPLKKTMRSREEIRAYVLRQMDEEKNPGERYAGARTAEAFGLVPKGFDFDTFMVDLLTEQIAGLYDPKAHEFYIADWIPAADQKMVMAHELTHALEDQHFKIDAWVKAAKPDDDAELARDAVLEGSAMGAMIDYMLLGTGRSVADLPEFDPAMVVGDLANAPTLKKAPTFIKDALMFPYFSGLVFTAAVLKSGGWSTLPGLFAKPPTSTQQILHPALYQAGRVASPVALPEAGKVLGAEWKKLEDNRMGEFGWKEVLKQFLGEERAKALSEGWDGDRYMLFEQAGTKKLVLVTRLRLSSEEEAGRFFGQYSEALEKKHAQRTRLFRRPNFFSFETPSGGVFLRCAERECATVEGADRSLLVWLMKELNWGAVPEVPQELQKAPVKIAVSGAGPSEGR